MISLLEMVPEVPFGRITEEQDNGFGRTGDRPPIEASVISRIRISSRPSTGHGSNLVPDTNASAVNAREVMGRTPQECGKCTDS